MKKLLLFLLLSNFAFSQYSISTAERSALVSIYNSTNGEKWSQSWDLSKDPQNWYGIKIKNHSVTEINLRGNALAGIFPATLATFANLEVLDLSNNNLSGEVSPSIGSLSKLISLSINDNQLTGDPSASIGSLASLTELSIGHNLFVINNIEGFLQIFSHLKSLDIASLNLTAVPQKISTFNDLESLDLSDNQLKTGFANLSTLSNLKELCLAGNQLETLPAELGNLSQLTTLNLSRNSLATNYETPLNNLTNLEWLSLENNLLENIPNNIGRFTKLIHLNLGRNLISGNLSGLVDLKNLEQLFLNHNLLKDNFPVELLQLPKLQMLSLTGNQLSGAIPTTIPALTFVDNNKYSLEDIKNFLDTKPKFTDFTYSPQRYDEPVSVSAVLGENVTLKQSLSGTDYQFTWFKKLDEKQAGSADNYYINNIKVEDFTDYTCEAYFAKNYPDYFLEISFFREPISINSTLATAELSKNLSIYPNPTADILFVRAINEKIESISIFDMSGKVIFTDSGNSKDRVNVRAFPSGAYLILIKTPAGNKTFKFIKK